uniref:Rad50/SbcC-type AAA domain-containing protein n=1 Tax=Globodera rostochiensis TaxID=31243 RepID=A0A914H4F5_GLORO
MVQFVGLKIAGVRSIGDTPQCINFLTPLTIIQGLNGTGKTTIIEALNYVTTGALPAGKMQTFIHNAQIANTSRVDALVQLDFRDIKGNKCTATKRMNASTSHTGKLSTKSDEFTLKIVDKFGNLKSISSKICDFNKEMLNLLGVPKAVLEHVLFCHQEEANWPLSEPKELKVRFDAIFEVTKYVKALDNIKKTIKELGVQIQLIDKELPHLENNTRARADLRLRYDETLTALKHNRKSIEQKLKEERETVDKELLIIRKQLEMAVKCNHEFDVIQGQINAQTRFLDGMPPLTYKDSREQLQQSIDELKRSASVREADELRASVVRQVQSIAFEMNQCKKLEEAYRTKQMQHESRLMMIENRESEYSTLLEQYARKYDVTAGPNFVEQLREKVQNIEEKRTYFVADTDGQQKQLAEHIEKLRFNMAQLNSNSTTKRQECAKLSQAIASAERELRSLGPTTQIVDKLTQDIVKWESQLKQLSDFSLLDDVWQSLQGLQTDLNTLRMDMMELASSGGDEGVVGKATALLEKAGDKLDLSMEHIGTLKRRVQLSNQLAEFKDRRAAASEKAIQVETIRESIGEKSEQIKQLEQLIATAGHELPEVERQLRAMERSKQELDASVHQQLRRMALEVDGINGALEKIAELGESNERDRLSMSATPTDFREMFEEQKLRLENLACRKSQLEKQLDGDEGKKHQLRTLEDQLRRMEMEEQLEKYKKQLEDAKENATIKGTENLMELRKKEQTVGQRAVEVNNRIQQKTGEQLQLKRKVEELRAQLEETRYANAQKLYVDKLVERNVTSASIGDLERYYKVVDNAIINFHQQKMEQINQILHELWIRVYQGNDIDTIKIKSQPVSGVEKKKSYDYSVVMTVDQVDIDMRDRCSAGQKVLASILIRIALADVFAGNCRILALDEPTTNLDEDKVENIGSMLKSLIQIRKPTTTGGAIGAQRIYEADDLDFEEDDGDELAGAAAERTRAAEEDTNDGDDGMEVNRSLQLIVITHDRRLVEHLHLACRPEYIYSLAKDENGVSHIKEHSQITTNADLDLFA